MTRVESERETCLTLLYRRTGTYIFAILASAKISSARVDLIQYCTVEQRKRSVTFYACWTFRSRATQDHYSTYTIPLIR